MATSAPPQVSAPAAPKPRRTFHIQLDSSSPAEINFKQLVIESERGSAPLTPGASPSNAASNSVPATGKPAPAPRPQRFNIIEHLEKRYGGGAVLNDGDDGDVGIGGLDRRDDDDLYDSEDSFIDDTELQQNIEEVRGQTRVKTKHSGFFVNAGDEIETLEKEEDELSDGKSRRGKKRASNMLRLEARDVARNEREKLDSALETLTQFIAAYGTRATAEPIDVVKADIAKDKELGAKLHALLELQDEWVSKENDYRQMLKTEDKKHMKEPDYKPLNQRQERNRMFNRVLALFTPGLTDLQTLRALNKAAKVKTSKKPAQPKTPVKGATAAAKKKMPEPAVAGTGPVKRSIKPFKSRMMDETPPFVEDDFEEVEQ
ncbi:Glutathionyl-hydroquinone reductase YqjG [Phytophthora nicotianae]|uniref:Glutathionyl-hydroquinone reductase YqjG n=1 Tax=Phytophthora nicotianae TaxID=4792 RepID=A0A0W8DH69_PHYNI|nr:Glutathionyl-hydroquinone reductase YqjG [Phytophthora nicotianae]